jgi:dipeptidase E
MKLLLTSDGLTSKKIQKEFLKLLDKPTSENKVLIMHTANIPRRWRTVRKIMKGLIRLGIQKKNISLINIRHKVSKIPEFDVLYSLGGNTFYILDRVRKTGFDKVIKKAVKRGKLYIGLSAGSMITHRTIESADWGERRKDRNKIRLKNLKGLNFTNIAIFPHYKKRLDGEVKELKSKANYPILALKDKQALLINGKTKRIIK